MVLAKIGGHYINLEAIAEAYLDDRPGDRHHKTQVVITMIGGSVTILYGEEATSFIAFLEKKAQYNIHDSRD